MIFSNSLCILTMIFANDDQQVSIIKYGKSY